MKLLLLINKIALFTTLILFIIIYFGLLAQIVLGIIQVISAFFLTTKTYKKSIHTKRHLSNYWIVTITELILVYWLFYNFQETYYKMADNDSFPHVDCNLFLYNNKNSSGT